MHFFESHVVKLLWIMTMCLAFRCEELLDRKFQQEFAFCDLTAASRSERLFRVVSMARGMLVYDRHSFYAAPFALCAAARDSLFQHNVSLTCSCPTNSS